MKIVFNFFLRLFLAFLVAKSEEVFFGIMGGDGLENLLVLTAFFVLLSYLVNFLESYYHRSLQSKLAELGWRAARFLIGLNQLGGKGPRS
ncbi:MAG: hypothetical protein FJ135_10125 [Deltaproteobacteria bacterium]|nr:hypothetical protein [Deltaproteobacteria bacterium]